MLLFKLCCLILIAVCVANAYNLKIRIGMMMPFNDPYLKVKVGYETTAAAVPIAIDRIYQEELLPNVTFSFFVYDSKCDEAEAAGNTVQLFVHDAIDVLLSPPCSATAVIAGIHAKYYNIPMVSWAATDSVLGNRERFPTVSRIVGSTIGMGRSLTELLAYFGWYDIAFLYNDDSRQRKCHHMRIGFEDAVQRVKRKRDRVRFWQQYIMGRPTNKQLDNFLSDVKRNARIVVACLERNSDRRNLMLRAAKMGMDSNDYVYILPDYVPDVNQSRVWLHPDGNNADGGDAMARRAFDKAIMVEFELVNSGKLDAFRQMIPARMAQPPFNYTVKPDEQFGSAFAPFAHDAAYLYGVALNRTLLQTGRERIEQFEKNYVYNGTSLDPVSLADTPPWRNGRLLMENMKNVRFRGYSGNVVLDDDGSRVPNFAVKTFDSLGDYVTVAVIQMDRQSGQTVHMVTDEATLWSSWGGQKPKSAPECGWNNELCEAYTYIIGGIAIGVVLLGIIVIMAISAIRKRMADKKQQNLLWHISINQLIKMEDYTKTISSVSSCSSGDNPFIRPGKKGKKDRYDFYVYADRLVAARNHGSKGQFMHTNDPKQMKMMRKLQHDNICDFLGLSTDGPNVLSVWEFCKRGSLNNVLEKDSLKLDWFFKYSLIKDIFEGIDFLSKVPTLGSHGTLSSKNCVIDDRWRLKISEFGLTNIKAASKGKAKELLWTAPELLRKAEESLNGTKEADVYSLGIIISEILSKQKPYYDPDTSLSPEEIVYRVRKGEQPPFRPNVEYDEEGDVPISVFHMMHDCWEENPESRPDFKTVKVQLKGMMKGKTSNLMDHVQNMMEKYALTLEAQIQERTSELVEEKKKADILLYRILPRTIADKLKSGAKVEPETFESVTICFSDVVSFTTLANRSTPLQVVNLLNELYTLFDGIIDTHDIYKVETIGDGYMVVSGLPHRNGDRHAVEVAELSLDLMLAISNFTIPHLPQERIKLRIGAHSGSCVAGIVGLTMPRYCLFGDTVNTAARMESHGKPAQIQISEETNKILTETIGGYTSEFRGEIIVKGKGIMNTYWLLGRR